MGEVGVAWRPLADLTRPVRSDLDATKKTVAASKLPYEAAGWLGQHRGAEACEVLYGASCPFGKTEMMQLVSSVWEDMDEEKEVDNTVNA